MNSEGCVRVKIEAPNANSVQLDIGAVKYDLKKMMMEHGLESQHLKMKDFIIIS